MEYHHKVSPAKKKFKTQVSARKLMATVFWDADGFIHLDLLESGTTINSERYSATLKHLKQQLRRVQKHKRNILLQHANTRPHTSQATMEVIEKLDLTIVPHSLYSPHLAPCDFRLFLKMKENLCAHLYDSNKEVERTVKTWMTKKKCGIFS
jgi:histone-lysine N-methyltransferase SETMAR